MDSTTKIKELLEVALLTSHRPLSIDDFQKLFAKYKLNITNITQKNKKYINKKIQENINNYIDYYNNNYKTLKYNKKLLKKKNLTQITKIHNLLNYIHSQTNIIYQNYLYDILMIS